MAAPPRVPRPPAEAASGASRHLPSARGSMALGRYCRPRRMLFAVGHVAPASSSLSTLTSMAYSPALVAAGNVGHADTRATSRGSALAELSADASDFAAP